MEPSTWHLSKSDNRVKHCQISWKILTGFKWHLTVSSYLGRRIQPYSVRPVVMFKDKIFMKFCWNCTLHDSSHILLVTHLHACARFPPTSRKISGQSKHEFTSGSAQTERCSPYSGLSDIQSGISVHRTLKYIIIDMWGTYSMHVRAEITCKPSVCWRGRRDCSAVDTRLCLLCWPLLLAGGSSAGCRWRRRLGRCRIVWTARAHATIIGLSTYRMLGLTY